MIKVYSFWKMAAGITEAEFVYQYREVHLPMVYVAPFQRYVQSRRIAHPSFGLSSPFDGVSEIWWNSVDDIRATADNPAWQVTVVAHRPVLTEPSATAAVVASENVVLPGPITAATDWVKVVFGVKREAGVSVEAFQRYWREEHAIEVLRTMSKAPGLRRYVQGLVQPENYVVGGTPYQKNGKPVYDAIDEMWFRDTAAVVRIAESPQWRAQLEHARHHVAEIEAFAVDEHRVIWP